MNTNVEFYSVSEWFSELEVQLIGLLQQLSTMVIVKLVGCLGNLKL